MSKLESGRSKRIKEDDNTSTNDSDNKDSSSEIDPNSDTDPEADVAKASPRKKYVIIFKLSVNYVDRYRMFNSANVSRFKKKSF